MKRYIAIMFACTLCAYASAQAPADRREVRGGNRHYRKGDYKEAEISYRRALVKDSLSVAANSNLANTLYRMENYEEAAKYAEIAENIVSESSDANAADVFFNKGNIALQTKDYHTAVDAFKNSLLLNPGDISAKESYIYAKKMLEEQQNQGGRDNDDQNQDRNQDQDGDDNQNGDKNGNQDQNQDQDGDNDNDKDKNDNRDQDNDKDDDRNDRGNQNDDSGQDRNDDDSDRNDGRQPQVTPQAAQMMLQAIEAKEKETQDKVKKEKALLLQNRQRDKNW